jgi:hypothetical protein
MQNAEYLLREENPQNENISRAQQVCLPVIQAPAHALNHTNALAVLFTAAWQHPCQCLSAWARALAACWGIQLWQVSLTQFAVAMISCLLTSSTSPSQQRSARCEQACA